MPVLQEPKNLQRIINQPCCSQPPSCSSWCWASSKGWTGQLQFWAVEMVFTWEMLPVRLEMPVLGGAGISPPHYCSGEQAEKFLKLGSVAFLCMQKCWMPSHSGNGNEPFPRTFLCFSERQHRAIGETLCHRIALNIVHQIVFLAQVPYRHF